VGSRILGRAVWTESEELKGVDDVGVPVLFGDIVGPLNDGLTGNLDGVSAGPAQQVVVVALGASQIDRLAVLLRQDVHVTVVKHRAWTLLTIAICCAVETSHHQPTAIRAQTRPTSRDRPGAQGSGPVL